MLKHIWHIRDSILSELSASDSASLLTVANYNLYNPSIKQFLDPLRDILPRPAKFYRDAGYTIVLIGKDLDCLLQRIANPTLYYSAGRKAHMVNVLCIIMRWTPEDEHKRYAYTIDSLCPWKSNFPPVSKWHETRSGTDSKINIIYNNVTEPSVGQLEYTIGCNIIHDRDHSNIVKSYDPVSMKLICKLSGGHFLTKYIDTGAYPYKANEIGTGTVFQTAPQGTLYILLGMVDVSNFDYVSDKYIEFPVS